jgi:hypothetical protein
MYAPRKSYCWDRFVNPSQIFEISAVKASICEEIIYQTIKKKSINIPPVSIYETI